MVQSLTKCCGPKRTYTFSRLNKISGKLRAGTMTLILAPPGHGKSSYLRAMARRSKITGGTIK